MENEKNYEIKEEPRKTDRKGWSEHNYNVKWNEWNGVKDGNNLW
jgi:hypothetical protein